eukprot:GGOE01032761.1.p1 GENE.GGOE01032761.1~~GGOE01032761.1.p1  ORF type:complete len:221 (+),score=4.05 GGOE01032761.1:790-1452(+)
MIIDFVFWARAPHAPQTIMPGPFPWDLLCNCNAAFFFRWCSIPRLSFQLTQLVPLLSHRLDCCPSELHFVPRHPCQRCIQHCAVSWQPVVHFSLTSAFSSGPLATQHMPGRPPARPGALLDGVPLSRQLPSSSLACSAPFLHCTPAPPARQYASLEGGRAVLCVICDDRVGRGQRLAGSSAPRHPFPAPAAMAQRSLEPFLPYMCTHRCPFALHAMTSLS